MNFVSILSSCLSRQNQRVNDTIKSNKDILNKKIKDKLKEFPFDSQKFRPTPPSPKQKEKEKEDINIDSFGDLSQKLSITYRKVNSTEESSNPGDWDTQSDSGDSQLFSRADWLQIIKNTPVEYMSSTDLINSIRHGIPDELRPMIWEFLTGIDTLKKKQEPDYYEKLKETVSKSDKDIRKDINRTYTDHPFFSENKAGQKHLFNVLRAYANYDGQVGYTQGMNYIAGMLLILLDPENYKESTLSKTFGYFENYENEFEEKAFWIFVFIMCEKNFRTIYKRDLPKFHGMIKALENKLKSKAPEVCQLIQTNDLQISHCFQEKLLSMLFSHSPIAISKVILDMFFIEEEKILFKVLIRSILLCKKEILELDNAMDLLNFFNKHLLETAYNKHKDKLYLLFPGPESAD